MDPTRRPMPSAQPIDGTPRNTQRAATHSAQKTSETMCGVTFFQHKDCKHTWATVTEPCGPGMGFATCPSMGDGTTKETPRLYRTKSRPCPRCGVAAAAVVYDCNVVRMVSRTGRGFKLGCGAGEDDWGVDVHFARGAGCVVL